MTADVERPDATAPRTAWNVKLHRHKQLSGNDLQRGETMGGKRPDQYNIAPGEAGASDYKTLPEVAHGRGSSDEPTLADKQHMAANGMGVGGGQGQHFFDPDHPQPSHDANVHAREGHHGHEGGSDDSMQASGESPRERMDDGMEDSRERGVGA